MGVVLTLMCGSFVLAKVLLLLWAEDVDCSPRYGLVEYFAGKAQVSAAFRDRGHRVASYDYEYGDEMDFLSPAGFASLARCLRSCLVTEVSSCLGPEDHTVWAPRDGSGLQLMDSYQSWNELEVSRQCPRKHRQ